MMSERKWFDVKVGVVSVYAEDEEEAWEVLRRIEEGFPKRVDPKQTNFEMEVLSVEEAE